jgi:hypothetical protein
VKVESTFGGSEFYDGYLDATAPNFSGHNIGYTPGLIQNGMELVVKLDCFDEHEELLGTTVYRGTLVNARIISQMYISNFMPADVNPDECIAPVSHSGGPEFCADMIGFTPASP